MPIAYCWPLKVLHGSRKSSREIELTERTSRERCKCQ